MQESTKAALCSALVLPGCGHLLLRRYCTGSILLAVALAALGFMLNYAVTQAQIIADQILAHDVLFDPVFIAERVTAATNAANSPANRMAMGVLIVCWIIGIVDSYRLGRADARRQLSRDAQE